jgi:hypothetical protein
MDLSKQSKVSDISNKGHEFHDNKINDNTFGLFNSSINDVCSNKLPRSKLDFNFSNIQTKLKISQPGDEYEKEAHGIAEQIVRRDTTNFKKVEYNIENNEQKKINDSNDKNNWSIKRKIDNNRDNGFKSNINDPLIGSVLHESGQSLDSSTRGFMESKFGFDFSKVRIHYDSNEAINSRVY